MSSEKQLFRCSEPALKDRINSCEQMKAYSCRECKTFHNTNSLNICHTKMSLNNAFNHIRSLEFTYIEVEFNTEFCRSKCGILRALQIILGLICFVSILISCYTSYDPYYETNSGFIGGKAETAFILIAFSCLMWSSLLMACYAISVDMSTVIPKTTFEIAFNSFSMVLYAIISLLLLIEVITRNADLINGISEPGYAGKIIASIFGIFNTIVYTISVYYFHKLYKTLLNVV